MPDPTLTARTPSAPATAATTLFDVRNVSKSFGGINAVRAVSFDVSQGTVFAIIGPNGAGKSTLLNLLSGNYQPDTGTLMFGGLDLTGKPAFERARAGIARTFQKIRLFKRLTVLENVVAGFHIHRHLPVWGYVWPSRAMEIDRRRCREEALELLSFVGLEDRANVVAGSLAYGQQRMLEIARALATRPRLFMLDEPAAGLNDAEAGFLLERLDTLRKQRMTVILVEHNMELVMNVADRIFVLETGKQLFVGTPAEVQSNPAVIAAYLGEELY
jgi:branched-chain amino acid transport system ATP-binding protein